MMLNAKILSPFLFVISVAVSVPYGHAATTDTKTYSVPNASAYPATAGIPTGMIKFGSTETSVKPTSATIDWGDGTTSTALMDCALVPSGLTGTPSKVSCDYWGHQHVYAKPDQYTVTVTPSGNDPITDTIPVVPVGNFVIVSIGDSVASGEGSPVVPVNRALTFSHPAYWSYGDIKVNSYTPASDNAANACHGSSWAGPAIAARAIIHDNPSARVTFIHLACSGAQIGSAYPNPNDPPKPGYAVGQLDHLVTLLPPDKKIDALLITVGADNIDGGFGNVVSACVGNPPNPNLDCTTSKDTDSKNMRDSLTPKNINAIPYSALETRIGGGALKVADSNVYITDYFDPTHDSAGNFPTLDESKACSGGLLLPDEWSYLYYNMVLPLNKRIKDVADQYGWHHIGDYDVPQTETENPEGDAGESDDFPIAYDFLKHGYCVGSSGESWVVSLPQSKTLQGDLDGTAHPNHLGQKEYSANIIKAIYRWTLPVTTATATTSAGSYSFGTWAYGDVAVTLTATNELEKAGVGNTYFSVDDPACSDADKAPCTVYSAPFSITSPGTHIVYFFSANAPKDSNNNPLPVEFEKINSERVQIDIPSASDDTVTTQQDNAVSGQLTASNPDSGDTLTYSIVDQPSHGTVNLDDANKGTFTYTPANGYVGGDSFTFKVNNGSADSNTATESVTVADDPPVATDDTASTTSDQAVSGQLKASDPDSADTLTFSIVGQPSHGTVSLADAQKGTFTYTPGAGYAGDDTFTFTANDGHVDSNTATETIAVASGTSQPSGGGSSPAGGGGGGGTGPVMLLVLLTMSGLRRAVRRKGR